MNLAPFTPYDSKPTPENRRAFSFQIMNPADELTEQIIQGLIQIIATEGPTLSTRAFTLYAKKGGVAKLTPSVIRRLTIALKKATIDGKVLMERDTDAEKPQALIWLPSMKRVIPREYGDRGFDNIPASELGEVMFEMASDIGEDKGKLYEEITKLYVLKQLPKNATARLDLVYKIYLS